MVDASDKTNSSFSRILFWGFMAVIFFAFLGLGSWQLYRQQWKTNLIERVNQRVLAEPTNAPPSTAWPALTAPANEYRHVTASGELLYSKALGVQALTERGPGFWWLIPLLQKDGTIIYINRGFAETLPAARFFSHLHEPRQVQVTGLLRMNEPNGGFLRKNNPEHKRWYSRDILKMAETDELLNVAPYFIDAQSVTPDEISLNKMLGGQPVMGLTVIRFSDNHLVYAFTWFSLAALLAFAAYRINRSNKPG